MAETPLCECGHDARAHLASSPGNVQCIGWLCDCRSFRTPPAAETRLEAFARKHSVNLSAPAAPSVGEPEPDAMATLRDLAEKFDRPTQVYLWHHNADRAHALKWAFAELAALRSSLEEARKDSERLRAALEQASQTFQSLASPTRHHVAADMDAATEAQARRDIAEAGRVSVATALGSRVTR